MRPPSLRQPDGIDGPVAPRRRALRQLAGAATTVLLLGPMQLAHGASIVAVRVWPANEYSLGPECNRFHHICTTTDATIEQHRNLARHCFHHTGQYLKVLNSIGIVGIIFV